MLVGLRGVGKTVLLDHIERRCEERGFVCLKLEAPERRSLPALLVPGLRAALLQLDRGQAAMSMAKRALGGLRNFASTFRSFATIQGMAMNLRPKPSKMILG